MASNDLRHRIEHFAHTLGCTPVEQSDPNADWILRIDYPPKSPTQMNLVKPKGQNLVLVIAGLHVTNEIRKPFEELEDSEQAEIVHSLRMLLLSPFIDFQLMGQELPTDLPAEIQVSTAKWNPELLTMDSFAFAVSSVYKGFLAAAWHLGHSIGGTKGPEQQMRFKRVSP
jgi:hypothetical protein